jgi:hypothetical protein
MKIALKLVPFHLKKDWRLIRTVESAIKKEAERAGCTLEEAAHIISEGKWRRHERGEAVDIFYFMYARWHNDCPKCGAAKIDKSGKHGPFIGCSAYPKCDYSESIPETSA